MSPNELHILLIEDNPSDASLLEELMEEGHYRIALYCTDNGHDALDYLNRRDKYRASPKPDAILLDLSLPRMSGYDVLAGVRKMPHLAKVPVVVLTTSRDPKDREACMKLGAQEFISKPYNLEDYERLADRLASEILPGLCAKSGQQGNVVRLAST